jgi:hypothetical protein
MHTMGKLGDCMPSTGYLFFALGSSLSLGGGLVPSLCKVLDLVGSVWIESTLPAAAQFIVYVYQITLTVLAWNLVS